MAFGFGWGYWSIFLRLQELTEVVAWQLGGGFLGANGLMEPHFGRTASNRRCVQVRALVGHRLEWHNSNRVSSVGSSQRA